MTPVRLRRDPEDYYLHPVEADPTFNESRYYNFSGAESGVGGWVRMGNRPNEGHAEMTVCLYLPDGRVGFLFGRPHIDGHEAHDAAGLRFEVVEPYREHHVTYSGDVCVLAHQGVQVLAARRFGLGMRDVTLYPFWGVSRLTRQSDRR